MARDPRTPVIVGAAQAVQRVDPADSVEPLDLMAEALGQAGRDSGAGRLLTRLQLVAVVAGKWSYPDPGALLAARVGAAGATGLLSTWGGQTPQALVSHLAERIRAGEVDCVAVVGGETEHSRRRRKARGLPLEVAGDLPPAPRFGAEDMMVDRHEVERGVARPIVAYPVVECALRHARGESHDEHRTRIATLWHRFNEIAVDQPTAWTRMPMGVDQIRDPGPTNRMVGFPYTKAMCANNDVDMASALLLCSAERAEALGVPRDRWVFPRAATVARDAPFSNRMELADSPGIRIGGRRVLELAGLDAGDLGPVELYSCFPSVVQITMAALGLPPGRDVTVTGGLTFHGGPLNNYVGQSLAALVHRVRSEGRPGLLHGNGGLLSKHAFAVYATEPPPDGYLLEDVGDEVDALPTRPADPDYAGPVRLEAYTVMHDHDGPTHAVMAARTPSGARVWGRSADPATMSELMTVDACGRPGSLAADGDLIVE
jgi:acetyl-CoA C-acetyltransferase